MNPKFNDIKTGMSVLETISEFGCPDIAENFGEKYTGLTYPNSKFLFENDMLISKKSYNSNPMATNTVSQKADFILECA